MEWDACRWMNDDARESDGRDVVGDETTTRGERRYFLPPCRRAREDGARAVEA